LIVTRGRLPVEGILHSPPIRKSEELSGANRVQQMDSIRAPFRLFERARLGHSGSKAMMRTVICSLVAVALCAASISAAPKAGKNQMVKGTIKSVDVKNKVLVVSQKLKSETVDRQLDIKDDTEFVITIGTEKKEVSGKEGLLLLEGNEGAQVSVKCDKDVNVLKVTAKLKKK
jgi:hypothetical protein